MFYIFIKKVKTLNDIYATNYHFMYLFMHLFINAFMHCYFLHLLMFTYLYIHILSIAF